MKVSVRTLLISLSFFALSPLTASAASIYLDPPSGAHGAGDTFIETIRINNDGDCVNAANIALSYPKESLRAVDFSRGDSIFSLWAVEPKIDTEVGTVVFAGGIPGGYCGRIAGDAGQSNVLGKVIFTVVRAGAKVAAIHLTLDTAVYLNDGAGTLAKLTLKDASVRIDASSTVSKNPWLTAVSEDTTPPQPFQIEVESTEGVFNGRYYIVFSTTDKESGMDHFEIFEHGGWKRITTPYELKNQSLLGVGDIQVRAIDKAGNIRLGEFSSSKTPKRHYSLADFLPFMILLLAVVLVGLKIYFDHKRARSTPDA